VNINVNPGVYQHVSVNRLEPVKSLDDGGEDGCVFHIGISETESSLKLTCGLLILRLSSYLAH
jgi:hypothetical protein